MLCRILAWIFPRSQRGVPRPNCTGAITWFAEHGQNDEYTLSNFQILCKLLECGAGGGNRTIRAYSFYVTYCKHTNARTAQTSVCPPRMYKIMYNNSKAECVVGLLTPGCAPRSRNYS